MTKSYQIQISFKAKEWVTVKSTILHSDALDYIRQAGPTSYPFRIVRVVKTVVFEQKK